MAVQTSTNFSNRPFILSGNSFVKEAETIEQDAGRSAALAPYTVMAQIASSRKWVPLTSVDPTLTKGKMVCGAIGGSQADFAAVSDGAFNITVDGVAIAVTGLDFTDLPSVLDTKGKMVCGAIGGSQDDFAAVSDGSFQLTVDGVAISITGLDFTDLPSSLDTRATGVCAANGTNLAGWQSVADGSISVDVNGITVTKTGINFSAITTLDDVTIQLNDAFLGEDVEWLYDSNGDVFSYQTKTVGVSSTLSVLSTGGAGTDISAAGYLNGASATLVQGSGHDGYYSTIADVINNAAAGRFACEFDGDEVTFLSPTEGATSSVSVLTAGAAGTDISGASYLNGLSGTGTATAGTGHDGYWAQIADVINAKAAGRFTCVFDGDECTFLSPTLGVQSSVSVLSAPAAGTDISGASYLNGLTGTGTATAGSGDTGEAIPSGIYMGGSITAAELIAGDVEDRPILVGGCCTVDKNQLVLENSLALTDVVVSRFETVESVLISKGLIPEDSINAEAYEN